MFGFLVFFCFPPCRRHPQTQGSKFDLAGTPTQTLLVVLFFGCLSLVGSLRTFGTNRLEFWRESSSGVSVTAYFAANCLVELPLLVIKPLMYHFVYYGLTLPAVSNFTYGFCLFAVSWCASGYAYCISILVAPKNATLTAVIVGIVMGAFLGGGFYFFLQNGEWGVGSGESGSRVVVRW